MPSNTAIAVGKSAFKLTISTIAMDEMDLWITVWSTTSGMDVVTTKIAAPVKSFLDRKISKVLVSECNDLPLSNEEGKLIFASGAELAELDTSNLRTDCGREFGYFGTFNQKVFESWVCTFPMFDMFKWFEGWIFL